MPPRTILETYDYLRRIAPELSHHFRADAAASHNEEEFRIASIHRIAAVAAGPGIQLATRHKNTLATGRADAVYNRFIIEYENPGVLSASPTHACTGRIAAGRGAGGPRRGEAVASHRRRAGGDQAAFEGVDGVAPFGVCKD
jgi:hypothetical protein